MKRALFPGTFDPFTKGHLDLVKKSCEIFDRVWVGIAVSADKKPFASVDERRCWIEKSLEGEAKAEIVVYDGLSVDFMKKNDIRVMVRGLRSSVDFEFEHPLALVNQKLYSDLQVVFLLSAPELTHVQSKFVRELISHEKSLRGFVPDAILDEEGKLIRI